jgi:hypothetical protein
MDFSFQRVCLGNEHDERRGCEQREQGGDLDLAVAVRGAGSGSASDPYAYFALNFF